MPRSRNGLSDRQKRFCDLYIKLGNATQAAIQAGYSDKYVTTNTTKMLNEANINEYLAENMEKLQKETIASADEVLQYLTRVMRGEEKEEVVTSELIGKGLSQIIKVKKTPSLKDRNKAADLLSKRYGLNIVKIQSDDDMEININYNPPKPEPDNS